MRLYVVRHGDAVGPGVDPNRPLSATGRAEVEAVGERLVGLGLPAIDQIWHSTKTRARQTAEILAGMLPVADGVREVAGITPNDDPRVVADQINELRGQVGSLMLVGHLPHVALLTGWLLAAEPSLGPVRFTTATVAGLSWGEQDGWALDFCVGPRHG